jgi:hypothetical protein
MSTDQIQTKLFQKADAATTAAVAGTLKTVQDWVSSKGYDQKITIELRDCALFGRDGVPIRTLSVSDADMAKLVQSLAQGHIKITMTSALSALSKAMFNTIQGPARVKFVDDFIADVQRLKDDVEDLQSRVE